MPLAGQYSKHMKNVFAMAFMSEHMESDRETIPDYITLDRNCWQSSLPGESHFALPTCLHVFEQLMVSAYI